MIMEKGTFYGRAMVEIEVVTMTRETISAVLAY